jgi:eukaryotic-like serine/threonine-protein kinase
MLRSDFDPEETVMALEPGQIIEGKYRILRLLGEGGMGAVYEGENVRIHRKVAIKVLHQEVAANADVVKRFEREAQAAGRIGSDHIVEVLDLGNLPDGDRFMVMEFLEGDSLSERIKQRGRIPAAEIAPIVVQLLEGLGAAHVAGIIHRDLKPDNVYLLKSKKGQADFVKILDFGISKFNALSGESAMSMTRTGSVMGTPFYMSPEQAKGAKDLDVRSDLYSTGVILYEAVTGQVPFNAETFNELIFKIVLEVPPPPEQLVPDLDPAFGSVMRKAMAREREDRFQTAQEFAQALTDWQATGTGVAAGATGAVAAQAPGAVPGVAPALGATGTSASWSNTGGGQTKKSPVIAIGAVVAIGLLGLGGFVAFKTLNKAPSVTDVAAAAPAPETVAPAAPQPPVPTVAAAPSASAEPAVSVAAASASAAPEPAPAPTAEAKKAAAPVTRHVTKKAPSSASPPAAATHAPASTGRKIRTEL